MYDDLLRLDLDDVKTTVPTPSFVVFHDGRTVLASESSHGQTVIQTCRQFYPEWKEKFDKMIQERMGDFDEEMSEEEKEKYSCMLVLNGEYLERRGFVLIHNILDRLIIFGFPKMTDDQRRAVDKINDVFKIDGWPEIYN